MVSRAQTITVAIVGDTSRLSSSLSDGQRRVQNFGIAATAALAAFGIASVKAYAEREEAQRKLNFALEKSPKLYDVNTAALMEYNSELAAKVAIDDDVIAGAQAVLARFAQSEEQLLNLTELSADYARITGTDIVASAGVVGKALLGNTRALKALGISYTATGNQAKDAAAIQQMLNEKIGGYAEEYAGTAAGKAEELNRQWGEMQETVGEALLPALTSLMDVTKPLITAYNSLPKPIQQAVFGLGLLGAVAMAVGPRILVMKKAMDASNITLATTKARAAGAAGSLKGFAAGAVSPTGLALTALLIPIGAVIADMARLRSETELLKNAVGKTDRIEAFDEALSDLPSAVERAISPFQGAWGSITRTNDVLAEIGVTSRDVGEALKMGEEEWDAWVISQVHAAEAAGHSSGTVNWLMTNLNDLRAAQAGSNTETEASEGFMSGAAAATGKTAEQVDQLTEKVQGLIDKFTILKQGYLDSRQANRAYQAAVDDASTALQENGKTLNQNSEAGRANAEALDGVAEAGNDVVHSLVEQGASQKRVMDAYRESRSELVETARSFGMTKEAAQRYAEQILRTPKQVRTDVLAITDKQKVLDYQATLRNTPERLYTDLYASLHVDQARAGGGRIYGVGGPRDDKVVARVSPGEYVINAASAKRIGYNNLDRLNRFADGGAVGGSGFSDAQKSDWQELLSRMRDLVQAARANLKELKGQRRDFQQNLSSSFTSQLTVAGTVAENRDNDAAARLTRFRKDAQHIIRFMGQLNRLRRKGLRGALYNEIRDLGAEQGSIVARQLLADPDTIDGFMRTQRRLDRASDRFANQAGRRKFGDDIDQARDRLNAAERARDRAREARSNGVTISQLHLHLDKNTSAKDRREVRRMAHMLMEEIEQINRKNGHANRKNGRKGKG